MVAFAENRGMFDPESKNYISPDDIERIKNLDPAAIDSLHNITNPGAGNEALTIEVDTIFSNKNNEYNVEAVKGAGQEKNINELKTTEDNKPKLKSFYDDLASYKKMKTSFFSKTK